MFVFLKHASVGFFGGAKMHQISNLSVLGYNSWKANFTRKTSKQALINFSNLPVFSINILKVSLQIIKYYVTHLFMSKKFQKLGFLVHAKPVSSKLMCLEINAKHAKLLTEELLMHLIIQCRHMSKI